MFPGSANIPDLLTAMCMTPLKMKNTYFGSDRFTHQVCHDTEHVNINIPCGHCPECIAAKQTSWVQRMTEEAKYNHFFFVTLTYDDKHLPKLLIKRSNIENDLLSEPVSEPLLDLTDLYDEDCHLVEGAGEALESIGFIKRRDPSFNDLTNFNIKRPYESPETSTLDPTGPEVITIKYADIHHLQLMFKRMRDNNTMGRDFRYISVSERGSKGARPHFHIIFLVPKQPGDSYPQIQELESRLKDMLLQYWSTNIGTRKCPVYERNFTYRQRWIAGKLYRNFDCHYVQPNLTTNGVANVAYYVTKYIFKESPREEQLRKLLFANLVQTDDDGNRDLTQYKLIWDIVKSRMVCSKGLGIDGAFVSVESARDRELSIPEYAEALCQRDAALYLSQDLPADDYELAPVPCFKVVYKKKRILVPNFDLIQYLKDNALLEKERGVAIYVAHNGEHLLLSQYYKKRVLSLYDLTDLYYSWDQNKYPDTHDRRLSQEEYDKKYARLERSRKLNSQFGDADGHLEEVATLGQDIDPYSEYRSTHKLVLNNSPRIALGQK